MQTSPTGRRLIERNEGCRLRAYKDAVGIWTIGYGHTGSDVGPRTVIMQSEADELLAQDLAKFENYVINYCKPAVPNQAQFDAMVSLCYNIGPANFKKSAVLRYFRKGDYAAAANAFSSWTKARDRRTGQLKVLPGLVKRRSEEKELFLTTTSPNVVKRTTSSLKEVAVPEASVVPEAPKSLGKSREIIGGGVVGIGSITQLVHNFSIDDAAQVKQGVVEVRDEGFMQEFHIPEVASFLAVVMSGFIIWKRISDRKAGIR